MAYRIVKALAALDEADVEARVEFLELGARHVAEHAPRGEAVRVARLKRQKWGQAGVRQMDGWMVQMNGPDKGGGKSSIED